MAADPEIPEGLHQVLIRLGKLGQAPYVLTTTTRLEEALKDIIITRMPNLTKDIEGMHFKGTGSFSSFGGRIDMAYALGLINKTLFDNLHVIRSVRNRFAHPRDDVTFEDKAVRRDVEKFRRYYKHADHYTFFVQIIRLCEEALKKAKRETA